MLTSREEISVPIDINKITQFLKQQTVIRIYFDSMPYGAGNQANSLNIMKRLRQLGFVGKFECLYLKGPKGAANKKKIGNLFNLPADFSDVYYDEKTQSEFIELSLFLKALEEKKVDHHAISFSGGQLKVCVDGVFNSQLDLTYNEARTIKSCSSEAALLDTDIFVNIMPYFGKAPGKLGEQQIVSFNQDRSIEIIHDPSADKKFLLTPIESLAEAEDYLENSKDGNDLLRHRPALSTLIEGIKEQKFWTMPMYGWPIQLPKKNPEKESIDGNFLFPGYILHYIFGARYAQLMDPTIAQKPLIIPIFYEYEEELKIIKQMIVENNWGEYAKKWNHTPIIDYIERSQLNKKLKVVSLHSPTAIDKINELVPGEMLLISMGKFPQPVFNGLYFAKTALTYVYEGENTRNALLSAGEKPFLRSLRWDFSFYGYGPQDESLAKSYSEYESGLSFLDRCVWIGKFIMDAQKKGSPIEVYFSWLYEQARKPENDRILFALDKAITILEKDKKYIPNNTPPSLPSHLNQCGFFSRLSKTFQDSISAVEKGILKNCVEVTTNCKSYFPPGDLTYWQRQLNEGAPVCCKASFFNMNGQCYSQPLITATAGAPLMLTKW